MTLPRSPLLFGLEAVPIRDGGWIDARDVPEPFRTQFLDAMRGQCQSAAHVDHDGHRITTAHSLADWREWASGNWRWGGRPCPDV